MKFKSNNIIQTRDNISKDKAAFWHIIHNENIMSKKEKKAGMGSGYDLLALYNHITQLSESMVKMKLYLQAINTGYTNYNDFKEKEEHWRDIFTLCEKKELWKGLGKIKTIDPTLKSKLGKKITQVESFSNQRVQQLRKNLQLEINALMTKITKFNDDMELEVGDETLTTEEKHVLFAA